MRLGYPIGIGVVSRWALAVLGIVITIILATGACTDQPQTVKLVTHESGGAYSGEYIMQPINSR